MTLKNIQTLINIWRYYTMSRNAMNMVRNIGTGLAAGIAVGLVGSQMMKNDKQIKRKAGRAVHAVGDLLDNVQYMFK